MSTLMPTFKSSSFSVIWLGFPTVRLFETVPLRVWLGKSQDSMRRKEMRRSFNIELFCVSSFPMGASMESELQKDRGKILLSCLRSSGNRLSSKSLIIFAASWCRCWTRMTALLKSRWFSEALPWFTNKLTRTTDNSTNAIGEEKKEVCLPFVTCLL